MPPTGGGAFDIGPEGPKPALHLVLRQHREGLLDTRRGTIAAALSEKENVLNAILDHSPRLVRLAVESGPHPPRLSDPLCDPVAEDWGQTIKNQPTAANL